MNTAHEGMDDMGDFAMSRQAGSDAHSRPYIPQGCDQQGRHEPTIEPKPENAVMGMYSDADEEFKSADKDVAIFMMKFLGAIAACLLAAWIWASGVWMEWGVWA